MLLHKSIDIMYFSDEIKYVFYNGLRKTQHILYVHFVLCISYIVCKYDIVLLANSLDGESQALSFLSYNCVIIVI
jgi:hypothetical protein